MMSEILQLWFQSTAAAGSGMESHLTRVVQDLQIRSLWGETLALRALGHKLAVQPSVSLVPVLLWAQDRLCRHRSSPADHSKPTRSWRCLCSPRSRLPQQQIRYSSPA